MTTRQAAPTQSESTADTANYDADLWRMADALRGSMDASEYKHVVLGLIFLKYISDAFEEAHARLEGLVESEGADPEHPDEYRADGIFWVPREARWANLQNNARQSTIGRLVDDAMIAIERDNPILRDVLPKEYARQALDQTRLGQVIDLISDIRIGDAEARAQDVLGRSMSIFWDSSHWRKDAGAANSTRRAVSSDSSWKCCNLIMGASMTLAAAHQACSCSLWSSYALIAAVLSVGGGATVAERGPTSLSMGRSRTTRPGGSPR